MKLQEIGTSLDTLPGVGPARAKLFNRLNIFTIGDLLGTFPRDYEDRTKKVELKDFNLGKVHTICKVTGHQWFGYGAMKTLKISITDGSARASLIAFNRSFLEKTLPEGSIISVTGSFAVKYNELQSTAFEAEKICDEGELSDFENYQSPDSRIIPVYSLTEGLSQKNYIKAVNGALEKFAKTIDDELPQDLIQSRKLLHKSQALIQIHHPENLQEMQQARNTLIYEELFGFEYKMALRAIEHRGSLPTLQQTSVFEGTDVPDASKYFTTPDTTQDNLKQIELTFQKSLSPKQKDFISRLPFSLTKDQMQTILDMNRDIDKSQDDLNKLLNKTEEIKSVPFSMQRLLQGDVGSGKTLVAFFVCLRVIDYGGQCALLAPTELLARQHAENAAQMLSPVGVRVAFLTGNLKAKGRENLVNALKNGEIDLVIGTQACFRPNTTYKNLALAVIDEQHRFGVAQRESIVAKGRVTRSSFTHTPDLLMMSATPIPQTLALTVFGDLDVSTIKTMPAGRKPVKTLLVAMGHEDNVYQAVRQEINAGHQAYFVYPRIDEDGQTTSDLKSASEMFEYLSTKVYPDIPCALIHSKVPEDEQNRILSDYKDGKIKILVATTVVEVGVDVGNATCIVIEHADRFGLAELHQLRGRVGRSSLQSYCILIYGKNISQTGIARLKALHESTDGFKIAEEDLKLRGPGEVSGTMQSGYLTLNIADLSRDKDILQQARYDAFNLCNVSFKS